MNSKERGSSSFPSGGKAGGETNACFESLRDWCNEQALVGPPPRLVVDRELNEGVVLSTDTPDGPVVRMHPAMRVRFERWLDMQIRFLF